MTIPFSKTMRMSDFADLGGELEVVENVLAMLNGGDKAQHPLRKWEYAMALKAFRYWDKNRSTAMMARVSDHGCCTGMLAPMMYWMGHDVRMYEVWAWGDQQNFATWQMEKMREAQGCGTYRWINKPLGQLTEDDRGVDVAFCISTIEHISGFEHAFRQMCDTVDPGGMIFITSDSAEDEHDHYIANNVRAGTMFNKTVYEKLAGWGREMGFELMGGTADWSWDESCRLIPAPGMGPTAYGFACMAMERKPMALSA